MTDRETGPPERAAGSGRAPASLSAKDLERVIHRAAELQFAEGEPGSDVLDEEEVLRIGREVGLPDRHLRRALSELRAEALLPRPTPDSSSLRKLLGVGVLRASRVVPGEPHLVQERLEAHLRDRESLSEVRRRRGFSMWEPSGGIRAQLQRALNWEGRGYELAKVAHLELVVSELDEGWSLVSLTADLRNVRTEHLLGWSIPGMGALGVASVAVGLATAFPLPLAVGAGLGAAAGGALLGGRSTFRSQRDRIRLRLEGLLDRLERGDTLGERGPGWPRRLLE